MSLKPIYELDTTTMVDENHNILVYQDNRLKTLNSKEVFYTKDEIHNKVVIPKNNIIESLANLHVKTPSDVTLYDLINYVDKIDLFEIGVRRLVHDGTDTREFTGTPSVDNNPKFVNMGNPQTSNTLERCYKIGGMLTVIPRIISTNPDEDLIYAGISSSNSPNRNDFHGGLYASDKWSSGIYPWNSMEKVTDEHGNYFTKVPLYFIKEEYVTDTGIDVSASWPTIPDKYINNIIYKYIFVCKTRLPGYRPAEFFYDYKKYNMIEDNEGEYVYIQDLECYTIPLYYNSNDIRYKLSTEKTDTYTKILTRDHYFSCYEASTEIVDGKSYIASKPNIMVEDSIKLPQFRTLCKDTDEYYYISDMRSHVDFFCTLFSIEFATTNCQSVTYGSINNSTDYMTGQCDDIEFRTAYNSNLAIQYAPFKWNWIENIYGGKSKYIDGIMVRHESDENGLLENCVYLSNNPDLYNDTLKNYTKLRYILPSEFLNSSNVRTASNGYVTQLGYDPVYPWCQLPSKCSSSVSGYCDRFQQASNSLSANSTCAIITGVSEGYPNYSGLYSYYSTINDVNSRIGIGIFFEKPGK